MYRAAVFCVVLIFIFTELVVSKSVQNIKSDVTESYKTVVTQTGAVKGHLANDGDYYAFLGIPYAAPPIGKNRFKAPLPPKPWNDILEANRTVKCPQQGQGEEDCLVLNVFTPTRSFSNSLPIFFYVHGGSFIMGQGPTEGVQSLIKQNIIVVTINYRLGALGFLCLGIDDAPGNAGLKDQVAALRWVRNNIAFFGGDQHQVTIGGMSAGGASIEYQILSKMASGLYQRAVIESGSTTSVWTVDANPVMTAVTVAKALKFPKNKNIYNLIEYYQQVAADELSVINYDYYNNLTDGTFGFVPCVEKRLNGIDPFITEYPYNILMQERYEKIPILFSFASYEGLNLRSAEFYELNYKDRMEMDFFDFIPADLAFNNTESQNEVTKYIKQFYFGTKSVGNDTIKEYLNYFGDYLVLHGLLNSVEIHSRNDNPVYLMEFSFKGKLGFKDAFYDNINKSAHGDMIHHAIVCRSLMDENDQLTVDRVSKLIANFVKYGNPTPERTPLLPMIWPAASPNKLNYLLLDKDLQALQNPYWDRKQFWDELYARSRNPIYYTPAHPDLTILS